MATQVRYAVMTGFDDAKNKKAIVQCVEMHGEVSLEVAKQAVLRRATEQGFTHVTFYTWVDGVETFDTHLAVAVEGEERKRA